MANRITCQTARVITRLQTAYSALKKTQSRDKQVEIGVCDTCGYKVSNPCKSRRDREYCLNW